MNLLRRLPRIVKILLMVCLGVALWLVIQKISGRDSGREQYQTSQVEKGTIVSTVSASGMALTTNMVNVTSDATGVVKTVFVKDGDKVVVGQKIAEITQDPSGQQKNAAAWASYLSANNSLTSTNIALYTTQSDMFTQWKIFKDLAESTSYDTPEERSLTQFMIAQNSWLAAEAKYKNQQAVIDQAKASLTSSWLSYQSVSPIITAPIAGVVNNLGIVPGIMLSSTSSQRVAVIQNEAKPIVSVSLTEVDVPKVKIGQKVTVTLDSLSDKTFTGTVVTVDRIGTTSTNVTSYPSLIQLDSASSEILPNMAASANIIIETKSDVLLVPAVAIQTQGDQTYVRVLRNGREQQVPVEVGIFSDTQTEIISGLSEGDEVVTGTVTTQTQQGGGTSVFGGFGGGLRTGGFGGSQRR